MAAFILAVTVSIIAVSPTWAAAPAAPSNIRVVNVFGNGITVAWDDNSNDEGTFDLQWAANGVYNSSWAVGPNVTSASLFLPGDLFANTPYSFRVRAQSAGGDSAFSTIAAPVYSPADQPGITADPTAPTALPTYLPVAIQTKSNPSYTRYAIRTHDGKYVNASGVITSETQNPIYFTSSQWGGAITVTPNTFYQFSIVAVNEEGRTTIQSVTNELFTKAAIPAILAVDSPTETTLRVQVGNNGNPVGTDLALFNEATQKYVDTDGYPALAPVWSATPFQSMVVKNLNANTVYRFSARARNANQLETTNSAVSAPVYTLPSVPTGLISAATSENSISLTWQGNGSSYSVFNMTTGQDYGWVGATTYTATNLTCNTFYQFKVKARNNDGQETDYSLSLQAKTTACTNPPIGNNGGNATTTPPVVPPPAYGGGATVLVTVPPSCPVTIGADTLIKIVNKPAIYILNDKLQYRYFADGDVFKSWNSDERYSSYYTAISQECFDDLTLPPTAPFHVFYRPGSYVFVKQGKSQLYTLAPGNRLIRVSANLAKALYGNNYQVKTIGAAEAAQYSEEPITLTEAKAHAGMLVSVDGQTWYVDEGLILRAISADGLAANRFKSAFIHAVSASAIANYTVGTPITAYESRLSRRI